MQQSDRYRAPGLQGKLIKRIQIADQSPDIPRLMLQKPFGDRLNIFVPLAPGVLLQSLGFVQIRE